MKLGRFTNAGSDRFGDYLDQLEVNPNVKFPEELFSFPGYFQVLDDEIDVIHYNFKTRFAAAKYLMSLLSSSGIVDAERDIPLWVALTAYYFDVLCPINEMGVRKPRERSAYIPEPENYRRYYRHLLLGPYLIYRAHKDNPAIAMALLCKPPHVVAEVEAQIAAYQEFVTNRSIVELATRLYYDPKSKTTKPGASSKGPGSPRRYVSILRQLDLTWDLYATTTDELADLLPQEFEKFLK